MHLTGPIAHAVAHGLPVIRTLLLIVSVCAAVPTARNLYYSFMNGIPFNQVSYRLEQYDLWNRNFDCQIEYRALSTGNGGRIDAGACTSTGDIAIKVTSAHGKTAYEWIDHSQLETPAIQSASLGFSLITEARAESATPAKPGDPAPAVQLAQDAGLKVMCQARKDDKITRIVQETGKCFREVIDPLKGAVEKHDAVDCTAKC